MSDEDEVNEWDDAALNAERTVTAGQAAKLASVATGFEWLILGSAVVGIIAGLIVILHTATDANGNVTHPSVAAGLGIIAGALAAAPLYWVFARSVRLFGKYVELRLRGDEQLENLLFYAQTSRSKECPECLEDAWENARRCPHCGHVF